MDCFTNFAYAISEGNPGARSIVSMVMEKDISNVYLLAEFCHKTGLRGSNLWVEFKKYDKNVDKFLDHVKEVVGPFP
jgi:hypothetical protein